MKTLINLTLMFTILVLSVSSFAQKDKWQDEEMRAKFEELEKIKLIETLEMNDETTLRFFARQSEHKNEQMKMQDEIKANLDDLDAIIKGGRVVTTNELKSKINAINELELQIEKNRVEFINSLPDILSYEQIAQLLLFERRFRNEVRRMIMKDRRPPKDRE